MYKITKTTLAKPRTDYSVVPLNRYCGNDLDHNFKLDALSPWSILS